MVKSDTEELGQIPQIPESRPPQHHQGVVPDKIIGEAVQIGRGGEEQNQHDSPGTNGYHLTPGFGCRERAVVQALGKSDSDRSTRYPRPRLV